jgi:FkbM family methyltransferase
MTVDAIVLSNPWRCGGDELSTSSVGLAEEGEPHISTARESTMPAQGYEAFEIVGERGRKFTIFLPQHKGEFASGVERVFLRNNRYHQAPHVGVLALDYLKGRGTFIDVGANIGLAAIPAAVQGSRVIAVELLPENCLCLNLSILQNRLSNLALFPLAAGAEPGLVGFGGTEAWGHVLPFGDGPPAVMLPLDRVVELANLQRSRRFGEFVKPPLLIKIDTEGYELAVLKGASQLIGRFEPTFIVECIVVEGRDQESDRHSRTVKTFLEEQGYHLYLHRERRLVPRRSSDLQEGHVCDFFASRRRYRDGTDRPVHCGAARFCRERRVGCRDGRIRPAAASLARSRGARALACRGPPRGSAQ